MEVASSPHDPGGKLRAYWREGRAMPRHEGPMAQDGVLATRPEASHPMHPGARETASATLLT